MLEKNSKTQNCWVVPTEKQQNLDNLEQGFLFYHADDSTQIISWDLLPHKLVQYDITADALTDKKVTNRPRFGIGPLRFSQLQPFTQPGRRDDIAFGSLTSHCNVGLSGRANYDAMHSALTDYFGTPKHENERSTYISGTWEYSGIQFSILYTLDSQYDVIKETGYVTFQVNNVRDYPDKYTYPHAIQYVNYWIEKSNNMFLYAPYKTNPYCFQDHELSDSPVDDYYYLAWRDEVNQTLGFKINYSEYPKNSCRIYDHNPMTIIPIKDIVKISIIPMQSRHRSFSELTVHTDEKKMSVGIYNGSVDFFDKHTAELCEVLGFPIETEQVRILRED